MRDYNSSLLRTYKTGGEEKTYVSDMIKEKLVKNMALRLSNTDEFWKFQG